MTILTLYAILDITKKFERQLIMKIKESAENYLEAILMLKNKNGSVRSIDIANYLNFTKPSVSVAMKSFREEGYICLVYTSRCV